MRRVILAVTGTIAGLVALLSFKSHSPVLPVASTSGTGGLAARYDENHWICLEVRGTVVTARAQVAGLGQAWQATVPATDVEKTFDSRDPAVDRWIIGLITVNKIATPSPPIAAAR